jgi:recombination protein RecA
MKIGVMFGSPETTTGGRALKFYSSVRIDLRRIDSIKQGDEMIGNRVKAKIVKNKVAAPFREAQFEILFKEGISRLSDILDLAVSNEIINKSGSWFSFEDQKIGQGRESARVFLKDNPKLLAQIEKNLRDKLLPSKEK